MEENLLYIISWASPLTSLGYLAVLNTSCWFVYNERPLFIMSLILLFWYIYGLWKYRIRSAVLIDPPDQEDWINISTYEIRDTTHAFAASCFKTWSALRRENYLMWFILTCLFWISLAKVANCVSFYTLFLVIGNIGFFLGLVFNKFELEFVHQFIKSHLTPSLSEDAVESPSEKCFLELIGSMADNESVPKPSSPQKANKLLAVSASEQETDFEESLPVEQSEPEPESLTMYGAKIPSHDDSSDDDFLFDADHFKSSSSSTSNSFELIHF